MVEPVKDRKKSGQTTQDIPGATAGGSLGSGSGAASDKGGGGRIRKPFTMIVSLFTALIYLLVIIGALGYAVLIFRDRDERVKVAADYIESELGKAQQLMDAAPKRFALLLGGKKNDDTEDPLAGDPTPTPAAEPSQPVVAAPEPPAINKQDATPAPAPEPQEQTPSRVTSEETNPVANAAAPSTTEVKTMSPAKDDLSLKDLVNALEGRVEALSEEAKSLREKLDQSRKETRATPVADASSNEAATVVLAFALQKELDAGRPYADEIAALTRTGADPVVLGVLTTMAESGAPTGARLRENFKPLAKKIRAEEPTEEQDLASHIIHGASKLVRVRPTGTEQPETLDGNLAKIDAALTHDDFAAAAAAFAALPEWARSQGGEFAQTLDKRLAVAKASEDLLHGAIAALGGVKK